MCAVLSVGGVVLTLQLDVADLATVYNMCWGSAADNFTSSC
jgi:hypothetical protein